MQTQGIVILCIECQRLDWAGRYYCTVQYYWTVIRLLRQKVRVGRRMFLFFFWSGSERERGPECSNHIIAMKFLFLESILGFSSPATLPAKQGTKGSQLSKHHVQLKLGTVY
jgi:hypothetical protein